MRRNLHARGERGSALLEFAITLPLLVVFLVGIYDFSNAFSQKQKLAQAAQEGAIIAGAQPTNDLIPLSGSQANPDSLDPVVTAVVNSLEDANVVAPGSCSPPWNATQNGMTWTYTFSGCPLTIVINRGMVWGGTSDQQVWSVGTSVTVQYPYQWHFNSAIQLLSGSQLNLPVNLRETATVQNQS